MEVALYNSSKHEKKYWERSQFNLSAILPVYGIILAVCLIGNCLVCVTILRNKRMRSRWYYFLLNLAVADMGFALTTPIQILQFVNVNMGDIGCKSGIFILDIFLGTSLLSLAYISLDRYNGICRSSTNLGEMAIRARFIIPLIWLAAALVYLPMVFACGMSNKPGSLACDCHSSWAKPEYYTAYSFFVTLVIYILPFSVMLVCYYRICRKLWGESEFGALLPADPSGSKKRSIKMLIATTLVFFIAWTPYNCLYILKKLNVIDPKVLGKLFLVAQVLGFANSAVNPFIYSIFSKNFREGYKVIGCWKRKRRHGISTSTQKSSGVAHAGKSRNNTGNSSDTGYGGSICST